MNAKHRLIRDLDAASHRLGVSLRERGLNKRMLNLVHRNSVWEMEPDGDMLLVTSVSVDGVRLWQERHPVTYVVEVMEAIARRRSGNVSGAAIA